MIYHRCEWVEIFDNAITRRMNMQQNRAFAQTHSTVRSPSRTCDLIICKSVRSLNMKGFTSFKELNLGLPETHLIIPLAYRGGKKTYLYKIRLSLLTPNEISNSPPQWILRLCSHTELFIGLSVLVGMRHNTFTSCSLSFVTLTSIAVQSNALNPINYYTLL